MGVFFFNFFFLHPNRNHIPSNPPKFRPTLPYDVPLPPCVNLVIVEIACRDLGVQLVIVGHAKDVDKVVCKRLIMVINRGVGLKVAFGRRGEPCISFREWVFGSVRL